MYVTQTTRELFDVALEQYFTKLLQVSNSLRERQELALREYLEAGAAAVASQNGGNSTEYETLLAALRCQNPDQIASAQTDYLESLQKLQKSATATTLSGYVARAQALWSEAQNELKAHFAAYVEDVRNAFAVLRPSEADSGTLSAIGQNLITAAFYTAAAIPSQAAANAPSNVLTATF